MVALLAVLALARAADVLDVEGGDAGPVEPTLDLGGPIYGGDRIINGVAATAEDYPAAGGVVVSVNNYGLFLMCSSTLIAPDVVLLAGHCVDDLTVQYAFEDEAATIGGVGWSRQSNLTLWQDGSDSEWPDDNISASDWVVHEQFDITTLSYGLAQNYDVGLLFLSEAVEDVEPAILPTEEEADEIEEGDEVTVVGWGYTTSDMSGEFGNKMMGTSDISRLATFEFQVGELTESVRKCHGDSGGPTFRTYPNTKSSVEERLIGVTSHTYDMTDCENTGGVDTRVDFYRLWIDAEMRSRCADETRVWCEEEGIIEPPIVAITTDDLLSDIHLVGCASTPGAAGLAWLGAALGLSLRFRRRL